ncbi:MAG: hypothetical protein AAFP20_02140 [Cyanobacteria bacterium J06614_10]
MTYSNIPNRSELDTFLQPRSRYRGQFSPTSLAFNANLQTFSKRVEFISALETGGKITQAEAYRQIKSLWKDLKKSKKSLGIGKVQ